MLHLKNRFLFFAVIGLSLWIGAHGARATAQDASALYADSAALLWFKADGQLTEKGRLALTTLQNADREGLRPDDYLEPGLKVLPKALDEESATTLDLALSSALARYILDLRDGREAPKKVDPDLYIFPRKTDPVAMLKEGLAAPDFAAWLAALPPGSADYGRLRDALAHYRSMADQAWPSLDQLPRKLEPGASSPAVPNLRQILVALGDLPAGQGTQDQIYDEDLVGAVKRFQLRHGLAPDGVIGAGTRQQLEITPADRVRTIEVNLARLRWLSDERPSRYILVNVAAFSLDGFVDGKPALHMPVVVGRFQRMTPVLQDRIVNIIFRPTWTAPPKIAREDILPKVKADPGYLSRLNIRVFSSWAADATEVDPATVNWSQMTGKSMPFKFRQDAGPTNALGSMRFTLTNPLDIYLHDTPDRGLFAKPGRAFSSGCIRVSDPPTLAAFVLDGMPEWPPEAIAKAAEEGATKVVKARNPVPVFINYATAWVDEDGTQHFRADIYGRDGRLSAALGLDK